MRGRVYFLFIAAALVCLSTGCKTAYQYRVTEDDEKAKVVEGRPVKLLYGPLEYHFARQREGLDMRIINLSGQRIVLVGQRSYVMDPEGETHPLRDRVLGPGSYTGMALPPEPRVYPNLGTWPGGMTGWYDPLSGPADSTTYYWPNETYFGVKQPFEWHWKSGTARLRLEYQTEGKSFEHDFVLVRERVR